MMRFEITPRQAAELSGMPREVILDALRTKVLHGHKIGKRWYVKPRDTYRFGQINQKKIKNLSEEYVNLYWHGCSVSQLQDRVKRDFQRKRIVWKTAGFAEQAIYQSIMKESIRRRDGK